MPVKHYFKIKIMLKHFTLNYLFLTFYSKEINRIKLKKWKSKWKIKYKNNGFKLKKKLWKTLIKIKKLKTKSLLRKLKEMLK